jgi:hypothetical protein
MKKILSLCFLTLASLQSSYSSQKNVDPTLVKKIQHLSEEMKKGFQEASSLSEAFKQINHQFSQNSQSFSSRAEPTLSTVEKNAENINAYVVCYKKHGSDQSLVVASPNPSLLDKVDSTKTSDGKLVSELFVESLKNSSDDTAVIQYTVSSDVKDPSDNSKNLVESKIAYVYGRKALKPNSPQGKDKYLCAIIANN